jgi:nucleotide-binding universal stress UspA family protein
MEEPLESARRARFVAGVPRQVVDVHQDPAAPARYSGSIRHRVASRKGAVMYKHILVPTDGSPLSNQAIATAAQLAKLCKAKITGLNLIPPYDNPMRSEGGDSGPAVKFYKEVTEKHAREALGKVEAEAKAAGVPCTSKLVNAQHPWKAIIRVARSEKCDLIVMASHGRSGLAAIVIGSETNKVLTHSKIPVLVCR